MRVHTLLHRLILVIVLGLLTVTVAAAGPNASMLPQVPDQWGQSVSLQADEGEVRVAIVVAARRLRRIKPWEEALRRAYPDLDIVRVADFPGDTTVRYEAVAVKLRKRLPEDLSVGIDLDGRWAAMLDIDTSVPNLIIFDAHGLEVGRHSGMYNDDLFPSLAAELQALLGAPAPASIAALEAQ